MLKPICKNSQGERLSFSCCFFRCSTVGKHARQLNHFGEPAPIFLLFVLNCESHDRYLATILPQHTKAKQPNAPHHPPPDDNTQAAAQGARLMRGALRAVGCMPLLGFAAGGVTAP